MKEKYSDYLQKLKSDINHLNLGFSKQEYKLDETFYPVMCVFGTSWRSEIYNEFKKVTQHMDATLSWAVEFIKKIDNVRDIKSQLLLMREFYEKSTTAFLKDESLLPLFRDYKSKKILINSNSKTDDSNFLKRIAVYYCDHFDYRFKNQRELLEIVFSENDPLVRLLFLCLFIENVFFSKIIDDSHAVPIYIKIEEDTKDDHLNRFVYNSLHKYIPDLSETDPLSIFRGKPVCFVIDDESKNNRTYFKKLFESLELYCDEHPKCMVWTSLDFHDNGKYLQLSYYPIITKQWMLLYSFQWERATQGKATSKTFSLVNKSLCKYEFMLDVLDSEQDVMDFYSRLSSSSLFSPDLILDFYFRNRLETNDSAFINSIQEFLEYAALDLEKKSTDVFVFGDPNDDERLNKIRLNFEDGFILNGWNLKEIRSTKGNYLVLSRLIEDVLIKNRIFYIERGTSTVIKTGKTRTIYRMIFGSKIVQHYFLARAIAKNKQRNIYTIDELLSKDSKTNKHCIMFLLSLLGNGFDDLGDFDYADEIIEAIMNLTDDRKDDYIQAIIDSQIELTQQQMKKIVSWIILNEKDDLVFKIILSENRSLFEKVAINIAENYDEGDQVLRCYLLNSDYFIENGLYDDYLVYLNELRKKSKLFKAEIQNEIQYIRKGSGSVSNRCISMILSSESGFRLPSEDKIIKPKHIFSDSFIDKITSTQ